MYVTLNMKSILKIDGQNFLITIKEIEKEVKILLRRNHQAQMVLQSGDRSDDRIR